MKYIKYFEKIVSAQELLDNTDMTVLEFNEAYQKLLGKPAPNFDLLIHGGPSAGKSTFLMKFAKYLANDFGKVLYVSSEEFGSITLAKKVRALKNIPKNLFFVRDIVEEKENCKECEKSGYITEDVDLSPFNFVIIDSVNDIGINIARYKELRDKYPQIAFILVLQHTKGGTFKGGKEWEHEVEIAAEVKEGKVNTYKNRYGVLGEIKVFKKWRRNKE
jgi:predicted ATP-dependent serine protease